MIETRDDFVQVLATLGWLPWKDEVSDQCASIRIGGIVLEMVMGYRDFRQNIHVEAERQVIRISMGGSVTTDAVSTAYTLFFHPRKRYSESCIILQREAPEIKKAHVTFEDVRLMSDDLKNWAASCKIEAGLADLRKLSTNSVGALPAWHLAALAAYGDVTTLHRYLNAFKAGDRLGFAMYITEEVLSIALAFAERRKSDPVWLPKTPRLRV